MTIGKKDDMPATTLPSRKPLLGAALMGVTFLLTATTMNYSSPTSTTNSSHSTETAAASWSETLGLQDLVDYYYYYQGGRRRRLHHPHGEIKKYLMCTRLLATSDGNYDNSLDLNEFQDFSNHYADESMGVTLSDATSLPEPLQAVFRDYAEKTDGRNNQIIDIYGSRNGERNGITARQEELLENLCNETSVILDGLFSEEAKMLGKSVLAESTMKEVSHVSIRLVARLYALFCGLPCLSFKHLNRPSLFLTPCYYPSKQYFRRKLPLRPLLLPRLRMCW